MCPENLGIGDCGSKTQGHHSQEPGEKCICKAHGSGDLKSLKSSFLTNANTDMRQRKSLGFTHYPPFK